MSNFFDDDDEGDYNPSAVQPEPVAAAQPEPQPEAQPEAQPEYQPEAAAPQYDAAPVDQNSGYDQQAQNTGYDYQPEAAQPEQQVAQPMQPEATAATTEESMASHAMGSNATHEKADAKLMEATQQSEALMAEIAMVNQNTDSSGAAVKTGFEDEENSENIFSVRDPKKMTDAFGTVVKYRVTGQDSEGKFEILRRFKEFDALYKTLMDRWPGCYIPAIPEKAVDNKDDAFVELRRSLLERFMRECSKYEYLIESKEFKIFTRGSGEIDAQLYKLPRQTASQILEKYRLNFKSVDEMDLSTAMTFDEKINGFKAFITKSVSMLNKERLTAEKNKAAVDQSFVHYKSVYQNFSKFEHAAADFFYDGNQKARIMTHPDEAELEGDVIREINTLKNPWNETLIWLKGELLDTQGMVNAINGRDAVKRMQQKCNEKKNSAQTELDKLVQGKTTLKSFWKSKSGKEQDILKHQATIEQCNTDDKEFSVLIQFITLYLGNLAIDKFKRDKASQYTKMVNLMSVREIHNSYHLASLNHRILEVKNNKSE